MNQLFFNDLNLIKKDECQWEAYQSNNNTVIIAGPGSGKTRVLTLKAMKIIQSELLETSGIACLSFSKETVRELKKRLNQYGYSERKQDFIGTVHGFCLAEIIGPFQNLYPEYEIPNPIKIAPFELIQKVYLEILEETKKTEKEIPIGIIDRERYLAILGSSQVKIKGNPLIQAIAEQFEKKLKDLGYLDFVLITKIATKIIQEKDYVTKSVEAKFPWLLIDEYQDLGKALHEMVLAFYAKTDIKIYVVGDVDQSIYGFQGAYPEFLQELTTYDDFKPIVLKNNYRSNQNMIEASITALNAPPPPRNYIAKLRGGELAEFSFITCDKGMNEQFQCLAEKVITKLITKGIDLGDIAVITGSNNEASELAQILRYNEIPCYVAKWNFDTNSEVIHWLIDCAIWCEDYNAVSFRRLDDFWHYLINIHLDERRQWTKIQLSSVFHDILSTSKKITDFKSWVLFIIDSLDLESILNLSGRFPDEKDNISKLIREVEFGNLKSFTRKKFSIIRKPQNEVTVTTRHSIKGLEFEAIILLGMEESRFPSFYNLSDPQKLQEDHRVCYVCVSRAKKVCILIRSLKHTIDTKNGPWERSYAPSRFWDALHKRFGTLENTLHIKSL